VVTASTTSKSASGKAAPAHPPNVARWRRPTLRARAARPQRRATPGWGPALRPGPFARPDARRRGRPPRYRNPRRAPAPPPPPRPAPSRRRAPPPGPDPARAAPAARLARAPRPARLRRCPARGRTVRSRCRPSSPPALALRPGPLLVPDGAAVRRAALEPRM
jgi:hypothetical protein